MLYICKRQETITGPAKRNRDNVPEIAFVILQRATYTGVYTLLHKAYLEEI